MHTVAGEFDDLLAANRAFAETFALSGFDGVAHAGVAVVKDESAQHAPVPVTVEVGAVGDKAVWDPGKPVDHIGDRRGVAGEMRMQVGNAIRCSRSSSARMCSSCASTVCRSAPLIWSR